MAETTKETFYVSEGNETKVDMMQLTSELIYFDDEDVQVLGMPYEGEDLFMFVFLPRKRYELQNVLGSLNGKKLTEYLSKRDKSIVNVQLPRFKMESSLALKEALTALGLTDAFIPEKANFEGIAKEAMNIHAVLHKAFVETDEEGTPVAAASEVATLAYLKTEELNKPPPQAPREFVADHPFLYVITNRSGDVLFFGYMLKP
ncbi:serpin [Aphelenchoides avenae]|nr:serpin [Aphelenchus avenae]